MKNGILVFLLITILLSFNLMAQNVGIGTSTPVSKLEVRDGALTITNTLTTAILAINRANNIAGSSNQISFQDNGTTKWALGGTNIGSAGANNFSLYNYNLGSNALTILNSNNNVGIGTTDPGNYKLKISYDNAGVLGLYGLDIENTSIAFDGVRVDWEIYTEPDNIGGNGFLDFFYNGSLKGAVNSSTGHFEEISDERLKTNIKPMPAMLDRIGQLKPSTYQFRNDKKGQEYNGFIAQDVIKLFPTLVTHNVNPERKVDVYTMDYSGFGVIAIKGIQELQPIIEEQKEKIATLEDRITRLEAALATITTNNNGNISR